MFPAVFLVLYACAPDPNSGDTGGPTNPGNLAGAIQTTAAVATVATDWTVGALSTVDLDDWAVTDEITTLSTDPALVVDGGTEVGEMLVVLNRYNTDTVRLYALDQWSAPLVEFALEDLANPIDARICDDKLFITPNNGDAILVYSPETGVLQGSVDLAAYDDGDGSPEPAQMVELDDKLYVALNQLTQEGHAWLPAGGTVVEVDCTTETVLRDWEVGNNPSVHAWPGAESRVLVRTGAWFDEDGSMLYDGDLTVLEPEADTLTHSELTEENTELTFMDVAVAAPTELDEPSDSAVLVTADAEWTYQVWCVDLERWDMVLLDELPSYITSVVANDRGEVWVSMLGAGADSPSGIAVYDGQTCDTVSGQALIDTALPPYDVAFY